MHERIQRSKLVRENIGERLNVAEKFNGGIALCTADEVALFLVTGLVMSDEDEDSEEEEDAEE